MMAAHIGQLPLADQEVLLDVLTRVLEQTGPEAFLGAKILLPDAESFPDPLAPRGAGVATLIRRLSAYAKLPPADIRLSIESGEPTVMVDDRGEEHHPEGAVAWFTGIEHGTYGYGVRHDELDDPRGLLATLAVLVASAHLRQLGKRARVPPRVKTMIAEVTALTLGFGVLLLEGSYRTRTIDDPFLRRQTLPARRAASCLLPMQLAYLLAVQFVVRGHATSAASHLLTALSREHAELVDRALRGLEGQRQALADRLGLPITDEAPSSPSDPEPLPEVRVTVEDLALERAETEAGAPAYRLATTLGGWGALLGGLSGSLGVFFLGGAGFYVMFATIVLGAAVGHRVPRYVCSSCKWGVAATALTCSRCQRRLLSDEDYWHEHGDDGTTERPPPDGS